MSQKIETPSQIVNRIWKWYISTPTNKETREYHQQMEIKSRELEKITTATGAISTMGKSTILKLCAMESSWRFMALHSFMIYLSKATGKE